MSFGTAWLITVGVLLVCCVPWMVRDAMRAPKLPARRRLRVMWEPRDMWVGVYREPSTRRTYICLVPAVVLVLAPQGGEG